MPDRAGQLRRVGARVELSRVFRHSLEALAVNAVYLRAAFAASRHGSGDSARLEALRVAAGRASVRAEQTLQQGHSALATDMSTHYQRLHADTRRLAALAGLVRTRVEGDSRVPPDPATRSMVEQVEARLAKLAIRPGDNGTATPSFPTAGIDAFLLEQATYALAHIAAAHDTVTSLRQWGRPRGSATRRVQPACSSRRPRLAALRQSTGLRDRMESPRMVRIHLPS